MEKVEASRLLSESRVEGFHAKARGLQQDTKTFNLVTDVLLGAAVVGAGVTTYLFLSKPKHAEGAQQGVSLQLVPQVGLQQQGASLVGAF